MRRIVKIALAAALAALVAAGIRRLLEPVEREAIPASTSNGRAPAKRPAESSTPTRDELYSEAQRLEIQGRSKMNKQELSEAVEAAKTGGAI
jgi:hypothetical protein